jgi:hypothetical protein
METKICTKCCVTKNICDFNKDKYSKTGLMSICKDCKKIKNLKYRTSNITKYKEMQKKYRDSNKLKEKERIKIWKKNNKKTIIKKSIEYEKNRKKIDPLYKLIRNLRSRMFNFFHKKNLTKNNRTIEIIGCEPEFLKEYIESKFTDGMTWEKMGKEIHIDHIIPLSSAKDNQEVLKLCHYSNLQPLWSIDNLRKGNKY